MELSVFMLVILSFLVMFLSGFWIFWMVLLLMGKVYFNNVFGFFIGGLEIKIEMLGNVGVIMFVFVFFVFFNVGILVINLIVNVMEIVYFFIED